MRRSALILALGLVAACGAPERQAPASSAFVPGPITAPGLRLPDTVTPLAYDVKLDIEPSSELFTGEVTIDVRLERATDHVWLHADQIAIHKATWSGGALIPVELPAEQMRVFRFGRVVEPGTIQLRFTYTGRTTGDQEGLFRQRAGGASYVFSQGESVFARRIVPCFDEPRWKTPWRVTLVVPKRHVALSNMAETATKLVRDGKKQVTFAATPPLPSYLLAVAVGPFELVDAGRVGRDQIPVRVAVRAGQGARAGVVSARLGSVVDAIETYLDDAVPLTKLDLVGVPEFFGAMENPGLITFQETILLGDPKRDAFADYFTYIAAHELAHQWFGNLVTPAWWDHLWLSEAFASWLGDKVARDLDAYDDTVLRVALARREAITADREAGVKPLLRHVATTVDADEGFDAIAYAKGQLVLGTFESFIGKDVFRERVRAYLAARRGRSVTSDDVYPALATGELGDALESFVRSSGTPVVQFELRCQGKPELIAHAATRVPVCVAYGAAKEASRSCALVGAATAIPIGSRCPAWVLGNPDAGYYHVGWLTHGPRGPAPALDDTPALVRVIQGDDVAAAIERGELSARDAVGQLRELASRDDWYTTLGALAVARALDGLVEDAARPAWTAWLSARFAAPLASDKRSRTPAEAEIAHELVGLVPPDRFPNAVTRRAADVLDKLIPSARGELPAALVALAGAHGADKLFDRIAARARVFADEDARGSWLETLGELPASQIPKAVALVTKGDVAADTAWLAVARYFSRPETRTATWKAVKAALPAIRTRFAPSELQLVLASVAHLCDRTSRDEVAAEFAGHKDLTGALQAIDRCIERRSKLGDLAAALAAAK